MPTLPAFSDEERELTRLYLGAQVASMMGRKLEEGDWSKVYCSAKQLPDAGWSNLHIDVCHDGLGVEHKMLRLRGFDNLLDACGTSRMHPAATRSIRLDDINVSADYAMATVLSQYRDLIEQHTQRVRDTSSVGSADMRRGLLLWRDELDQFLYFEEPIVAPDPNNYRAVWSRTPARGTRKESYSLWIYEKSTGKKHFSVTTAAGIKIQPYYDIPPADDPNIYFFRVQGEPIDGTDLIYLWLSTRTAEQLSGLLGELSEPTVTEAVRKAVRYTREVRDPGAAGPLARPVAIKAPIYWDLVQSWECVSDEHRGQQLVDVLIQMGRSE